MANRFYNSFRNNLFITGATDGIDFSDAGTTIKAALIDEGTYTYSATHQYFADVAGGAIVGTPTAITTKTVGSLGAGIFDGDDVTYTAVTGASVESILLYKDTGSPSTSPLIGLIDNVSSGLPVTPNGGDITIQWDGTNGILKIG
jgi:hypothetical protein